MLTSTFVFVLAAICTALATSTPPLARARNQVLLRRGAGAYAFEALSNVITDVPKVAEDFAIATGEATRSGLKDSEKAVDDLLKIFDQRLDDNPELFYAGNPVRSPGSYAVAKDFTRSLTEDAIIKAIWDVLTPKEEDALLNALRNREKDSTLLERWYSKLDAAKQAQVKKKLLAAGLGGAVGTGVIIWQTV